MAALLLLWALSGCQSDHGDFQDARDYARSRTKEAMCKQGGKSEALHEIAATASAAPHAEVAEVVYEVASRIEREGCAKIIKKNAKRWRTDPR